MENKPLPKEVEQAIEKDVNEYAQYFQGSREELRSWITGGALIALTSLSGEAAKTYDDCKQEVATKHGLGKTLVTGHRAEYFKEAAELYRSSVSPAQSEAAKVTEPVKVQEPQNPYGLHEDIMAAVRGLKKDGNTIFNYSGNGYGYDNSSVAFGYNKGIEDGCDMYDRIQATILDELSNSPTEGTVQQPSFPVEVADRLAQALERAQNGLQWYRDLRPEHDSPADDETDEEIEKAIILYNAAKRSINK